MTAFFHQLGFSRAAADGVGYCWARSAGASRRLGIKMRASASDAREMARGGTLMIVVTPKENVVRWRRSSQVTPVRRDRDGIYQSRKKATTIGGCSGGSGMGGDRSSRAEIMTRSWRWSERRNVAGQPRGRATWGL